MKTKKGFTLVELLAVIVILGLLTSVVGASVLNTRNKANLEEAKKLEKEIESFGADVYLVDKKVGKYTLNDLKEYGLIVPIKNPKGKGECSGYLEITEDIEFKGYISCPNLYETEGYSDEIDTQIEENE